MGSTGQHRARTVDINVTKRDGPKVASTDRTGAERSRRFRERKQAGVVCVVPVRIFTTDIEALVLAGRLLPKDQKSREHIASAVEYVVDDLTKGKLLPARVA